MPSLPIYSFPCITANLLSGNLLLFVGVYLYIINNFVIFCYYRVNSIHFNVTEIAEVMYVYQFSYK